MNKDGFPRLGKTVYKFDKATFKNATFHMDEANTYEFKDLILQINNEKYPKAEIIKITLDDGILKIETEPKIVGTHFYRH